MNNDFEADSDNETPIKTVTFSNALHYLETENIVYAAGCKGCNIFSDLSRNVTLSRVVVVSFPKGRNESYHRARDRLNFYTIDGDTTYLHLHNLGMEL
ncbi:hypothetical protein TNCV_4603211 [Trichonephila clavipes]|nr:hypothetical protein TNCV_4603211 [Trichonephila clavipes]